MRTRPVLALLAVPVLAAALAACATDAPAEPDVTGTDGPVACTPNGPVSDSIEVAGDFAAEPDTTMQAPLSSTAIQKTVRSPTSS